jgi:hypothetical protein
LNDIKACYRKLADNFDFLSKNLINEIVVSEFVFPPIHENIVEIIQQAFDQGFYRYLIIEFVLSHPKLLSVA